MYNKLVRSFYYMSADYNEEAYENALIELFQNMGWEHVYGPEVDRDWHSHFMILFLKILSGVLIQRRHLLQLTRHFLNSDILKVAELKKKNAVFMEYLQNGIEVSYHQNGESKSDIIYIADFNNPSNNSFIVANQWTFIENSNKRPDILLFLNGLPICLFELKSPSREQTDASEADSMGVPAASGGRAIRGSAIAPLPKGNGCAAATIPNAFLLTKYQYNIGTMHIGIACHQTIQNYQK